MPPTNSSPMTYFAPDLVQLRTEAEPCRASSLALTVTTVRVGMAVSILIFNPLEETSMHSPLRTQASPVGVAHVRPILPLYERRLSLLRSPMYLILGSHFECCYRKLGGIEYWYPLQPTESGVSYSLGPKVQFHVDA